MCMLCSQTSPPVTVAKASFNWTPPLRSDLTSEPCNCSRASHFSRRLYLFAACLFRAMSAIDDRVYVYSTAWRIDGIDLHREWIAQAHLARGVLPDERRFGVVQVPAVAADPPPRQEALEAVVAEADKGAGADHAGDLALEWLVVVLA